MAIFLFCGIYSFGQNSETELLNRKITIQVSQATFVYALAKLAGEYEIPIGLEKAATHKDERKIDLDFKETNLKEVLDSIVKQEPAYRWELTDGVINFIPAKDRHEFLAILLDTSINKYAPAEDSDRFDLRNRILELPEVRNLMTSQGIRVYMFSDEYSIFRRISGRKNLSAFNTTVRGILNKVIRESEYKTWLVELTGRDMKELLISF
ncbi:MAG: hypothetical protein QXN89_04190 [Candidatus Woesearchaeota archaeon]